MEEKYLFHIYKIESDIAEITGKNDNQFYPIYIGCTKTTLKERFQKHKAPSGNSNIFKFLKKYGKEHFRIILLQDIFSTQKEAHNLELKISIEYNREYKLLNKAYGDRNLSFKDSIVQLAVNNNIYFSFTDIANALNIPSKSNIIALFYGKINHCYNYIISSISIQNNLPVYHFERLTNDQLKVYLEQTKKDKKIFSLNNLRFFSISEFAKFLNCTIDNIYFLISKKYNHCKNTKIKKIIQHNDCTEYVMEYITYKYIFNLDTKDVFTSGINAARKINPNEKRSAHVIDCCLNKRNTYHEHHFRYLTENEIKLYLEDKNNRFYFDRTKLYEILQKQFVFHIETNRIFESFFEAAKFINPQTKDSGNISRCCNNKVPSAFKNHWRYATIEEIKAYLENKEKE